MHALDARRRLMFSPEQSVGWPFVLLSFGIRILLPRGLVSFHENLESVTNDRVRLLSGQSKHVN